jgi:hypothetical protein
MAGAGDRRLDLANLAQPSNANNAAEIAMSGAVSSLFSLLRKPVTEQEFAERVAMMLEGTGGGHNIERAE